MVKWYTFRRANCSAQEYIGSSFFSAVPWHCYYNVAVSVTDATGLIFLLFFLFLLVRCRHFILKNTLMILFFSSSFAISPLTLADFIELYAQVIYWMWFAYGAIHESNLTVQKSLRFIKISITYTADKCKSLRQMPYHAKQIITQLKQIKRKYTFQIGNKMLMLTNTRSRSHRMLKLLKFSRHTKKRIT